MKNIYFLFSVIGSSVALFACDGSLIEPVADTEKESFVKSLSRTSWERECYPVYDNTRLIAYNNSTFSINSTLQANYKVELFSLADTTCNSIINNVSFTRQFKIKDRIISDESIETYGINTVSVDNPYMIEMLSPYSLIYINNEKLFFGQNSGSNLGNTPETRHSSISLDDYFSKIVN